MKTTLATKLGIPILATGLLAGGCETTNGGQVNPLTVGLGALGAAVSVSPNATGFQKALGYGVQTGAGLSAQMESADRTQVNVYGGGNSGGQTQPTNNNAIYEYYKNKRAIEPKFPYFFMCNQVRDIYGDGDLDFEADIFGFGKRVFNLDKETMCVVAMFPKKGGKLIGKSYTSTGELLGVGEIEYVGGGSRFCWIRTNLDGPIREGFMDKIRGKGPGEYVISMTLEDNREYSFSTKVQIIEE